MVATLASQTWITLPGGALLTNFLSLERTFVYTTPPLQPTPANLVGSPLLRSSALHLLASPQQLEEFVLQLLQLRTAEGISARPLLVWEPSHVSCSSGDLAAHMRAASLVDVYSPNHMEFLATCDPSGALPLTNLDGEKITAHALRLLDSGVGLQGRGAVVIRCGEHGSVVVTRSYPARWFPAFYDGASTKVVDATGARNAFLGALAVRFSEVADLTEAAVAGSVAASFAIEQVGLPRITFLDGKEAWNGTQFSSRLEEYRAMIRV